FAHSGILAIGPANEFLQMICPGCKQGDWHKTYLPWLDLNGRHFSLLLFVKLNRHKRFTGGSLLIQELAIITLTANTGYYPHWNSIFSSFLAENVLAHLFAVEPYAHGPAVTDFRPRFDYFLVFERYEPPHDGAPLGKCLLFHAFHGRLAISLGKG